MIQLNEQDLGRLVAAAFDAEKAEGEPVLAQLGFARPGPAFENLSRVIGPLGPGMEAEALASLLLETLAESADRDMALANWEHLFGAYFGHAGLASFLLSDPELTEYLSRLFGHSQYLADILLLNPEYIEWLESPEARSEKSLDDFLREMAAAVSIFRELTSRREALCRYHRREVLRIGLRDLLEWAPLETIVAELSNLAQASVQTALALSSERLQARFGAPLSGDGPAPCGFAVIAMGKLGGRELNYSSDIDLIFIYEAPGVTSGVVDPTGFHAGSISNQEYFAKLGADLIDFLSRHGPEGHLYRVDMRLRPEGTSGALAHSFAACQNYYLGRARTWERIALLKARGLAGDPALTEQFERLAEGFVFAPTSPPALLGEVASLKARIDHGVDESERAELEIKRGRGGIREIEFLVAALEILHGQNRPQLRQRSTLSAMQALAGENILATDDARFLESAYRFFRRIEHALQCMAWRQTDVLPTDPLELAALAQRCGIRRDSPQESAAAFESERHRMADRVHQLFEELFRGEAKRRAAEVSSPLRVLDSECPPGEASALLARWRLRDPAIVDSLRRLACGTAALFVSAQGQRRFEHLLPTLVESCRHAPWPDNAVRYFEAFIQTCGDAPGYYALLDESPPILDLLLRLLGTSSHLAQILIGNPGWFEPLVAPETFEGTAEWLSQTGTELANRCGENPAERLRQLREFMVLGSLRIGVRYVIGLASSAETARMLSALADSCIETATAWVEEETVAKEGGAAGARPPFAVLALGKLGRRELTFFSDLDLVFVSDPRDERAARLATDSQTFFAHIAERLIYYLTEPSAGGTPFRVDARLRPEGASSPLVTTLEGFKRHFERNPEIWEIQTYLGGRVVAGDRQIGDRVFELVGETIPRAVERHPAAEAICSMRARLEASVNPPGWALADFKRGRGGLTDLEFIAQYLQILHAGEREGLAAAAPREVFAIARERGWLEAAQLEPLDEDYDFLRRLELDVRLILETRQTCFPADAERLDALCHAPGREGATPESLRAEFEHRLHRVRELFGKILASH